MKVSKDIVQAIQKVSDNAKMDGYALFNTCNHHMIDMTHIKNGRLEYMETVSIKLPNGRCVTVNVMDLGEELNVDIQLHNFADVKVLQFGKVNAVIGKYE